MKMLKVLLVFKCIAFGLGLVIYDVDYRNVTLYGNAKIEMFIKVIDIFYKIYGNIYWCDFDVSADNVYRFCDIGVYTQACIMNQNLIGIRNPESFEGYEKRTFSINADRVITHEYKNRLEVQCGEINHALWWPHGNSVRFYEPNLYLSATVDAPYSDILKFTTYTGDSNFVGRGYHENFGIYSTNVKATRTKLQKSIPFQVVTYIPIFNVDMLEEYVLKAKCSRHFYGEICWYYCADSDRITCNCVFQEVYSNVPCTTKCNPGWIPKYVVYSVGGINEGIIECNILDLCVDLKKRLCDPPKVCLPVSNTTRYCEIMYVSMVEEKNGLNVTSDVFLYNEVLKIQLDVRFLVVSDVGVNLTTSINVNEYVFNNEILTALDGNNVVLVHVGGLGFIDRLVSFTITFYLPAWVLYISRIKKFRVNVAPDNIRIYHRQNWTSVVFYIYIGEHLITNTSGLPEYRSIFFWQSNELHISFNFGNDILVPIKTDLSLASIKCNSTLIMPNRNDASISERVTVFVKPFQFFDWNKTNNVLDYTEVIKCQAKAFIEFQLNITQVRGNSMVSIATGEILLNVLTGGEYELTCYFHAKVGYLYSTHLKFKLRVPISNICLFIYTNVVGSVVQCGHDGFIQDEYIIKTTFLMLNNMEWELVKEGANYLRIPYEIKNLTYSFRCSVTNVFDKSITKQSVFSNKLFTDTRSKYTITNMNKLCIRYGEYVEIPKFFSVSGNTLKMYHYVFHLDHSLILDALSIFLSFLIISSTFLSFGMVFIFTHKISNETMAFLKNNEFRRKKLKFRILDDKLKVQARKTVEMKGATVSTFYNVKLDDSNDSSVFMKPI